ncbi:MAG TPA: hypothetical protein PLP01_00070 [Phycisphaerae bacterium]|nr:hypothetical protein [Phycisphaerae bacterium]HOI53625.1 hypothetical protein [Phycisphaerae bacterium]
MKRSALGASMAVLLAAAAAQAATVTVDCFQYSDPAYTANIQVDVSDAAGVTGARAVTAGGTAMTLDDLGGQQFGAWLPSVGAFASLHGAVVGSWELILEFGAGHEAAYQMTVNEYRMPFTEASFPAAPTLISPIDGATNVSPSPTFTWDNGGLHGGPLESLFVHVQSIASPGIGIFEGSVGGPIALNDEVWTPAIVLPPGQATFLVQYETNQNEDANVDTPVFLPLHSTLGDPGIVWSGSSGDLYSRDVIHFTVVPEPGCAAMVLLGAAMLARFRRRRHAG